MIGIIRSFRAKTMSKFTALACLPALAANNHFIDEIRLTPCKAGEGAPLAGLTDRQMFDSSF
jgi:hypothetical protein